MTERPTIVPDEPTEAEVRATQEKRRAELEAIAERERQAVAERERRSVEVAAAAQKRIARLAALAEEQLDTSERTIAERWTSVDELRRNEVFPRDFRLDLEAEDYARLASWTIANIEDARARAVVQRFVDDNGSLKTNLILHGGTGAGKTTSAIAAGHAFMRTHGQHVRFISHRHYVASQYPDAINRDGVSAAKFARRIQRVPVLILDDFGAAYPLGEAVSGHVRQHTTSLLDARVEEGRITIVTTNLSTAQLRVMFDDRIVSRLGTDAVALKMENRDLRQPATW